MKDAFQRLDPRARILTVVIATVIIASTPVAVLAPYTVYGLLCLVLILTGRASGAYLILRCLAASPFILLAAGMLAIQSGITPEALAERTPAALSVVFKGYLAALLLSFLTATTALSEMLWALRQMKAPESLNLILGMMYRYTSLLSEEYARLERARESRSVRPLGHRIFAVHGRQLGALLLRSWDRAERVHAAMLSRGFDGGWPALESRNFHRRDAVFVAVAAVMFLAPRIWIS